MKADTNTLQEILNGDRRFVVPVYQRPYVWGRERQWEPLWADVESTAERLAETRRASHLADKPASVADDEATPHFLGAIVVEPYPTGPLDIKTRLVVDGQQRLITLQLLLMGTLDALRIGGTARLQLAQLRKLTRNDEEIWSGDDVHKVWPRRMESVRYRRAIAEEPVPSNDSVFAEAREFFFNQVIGFLEDESVSEDPYGAGDSVQRRASLLVSTLMAHVKLVLIDLEDVDDAQVIFEALNARNTPLSATDLVKNLLFMRAQTKGHDPEQLYNEVWARFDRADDWWRESIGAGHARRARQDWLMGDWLIAQRGRVINVGRLYGEFRSWLLDSGTTAVNALHGLDHYADAYERLHGRMEGATDAERLSFQRIDRLGVTVATPILLWLLTLPSEKLAPNEREMAFRAIESFVIRRMAIKAQTRAYGQVFAGVLRAAQAAGANAGRAIVEALRRGPHGCPWPTDEELIGQFRSSTYYGYGGISQYRLRLLLGAVDSRLQRDDYYKGEPVKVIEYDALQIEHVLPRSWQEHWAVEASDPGDKVLLEQERSDHVHRIGNLTLVSDRLNPALSNAPWACKKTGLKDHSHLRLNARLCDEAEWNEQAIRARGTWLAGVVSSIWPGPNSDTWE
ncbi:MAG: DUF262 domain-containing HNH endonuclease family protein [Chloroflexota bacterium]|nr:DUF262 domain-containing HNH endonuclease family protein [Chloroflexota bacterium]MDE2920846.1 DUF262 domain-containing HNH endonuclease family protein [Chloroflexota bacterium]